MQANPVNKRRRLFTTVALLLLLATILPIAAYAEGGWDVNMGTSSGGGVSTPNAELTIPYGIGDKANIVGYRFALVKYVDNSLVYEGTS